jgi:uncharacterized protein
MHGVSLRYPAHRNQRDCTITGTLAAGSELHVVEGHIEQSGPPSPRTPRDSPYIPAPGDEIFGRNPFKPPDVVRPAPSDPESIESPRTPVQHVAASFDCKSPKNPNERLICRSTELSELDGNMADLFNSVLSRLDNTARQEQQNSQRRWLKERLDCGDDFICTKEAYSERIETLKSVLAKLTTKAAAEQCRVLDPDPPIECTNNSKWLHCRIIIEWHHGCSIRLQRKQVMGFCWTT